MAKAKPSKRSRERAGSQSPTTTERLQVEAWPIERLLPYAANARTHPDEQVAQIAGSIAEFGFNVPCLVDDRGVLIAGHGRILAAKRLGLQQDPAETPTEADADGGDPAAESDTSARRLRKKGKAAKEKAPRTRADSKQAKLIEMLKRREGATIEEIVKAFDWQAHTVRGAIAGALKKKLGLNVISEKEDERGRVYRIA